MVTVQKMSGSQRELTKEGRMAMLKEYARRAANKYYWRHHGKHIEAESDELSQWAKNRVDIKRIVNNVMARLYPDKYERFED